MNNRYLIFIVLAIAVLGGAAFYYYGDRFEEKPIIKVDDAPVTADAMRAVVDSNNQFALDLYSRLRRQPGNLFFSPQSVTTALGMVHEGAVGETAAQIASVLHLSVDPARRTATRALINGLNDKNSHYQFSAANALWAQKGFRFSNEYLASIERYYDGRATQLDFMNSPEGARKEINEWVEGQTKGFIKDLFSRGSVDSLTRLVLTNAVYFKGSWVNAFDKGQTRLEDFYISPSEVVEVPLMRSVGDDSMWGYAETDKVQILEMPYEGEKFSMLVVLPKGDLKSIEKDLSLEEFEGWKLGMYPQKIDVYVPKFSLDQKYEMKDVLGEMGMPLAFTDLADFSGMTGKNDLAISQVIHQARVEVDEEGTVAAAATGVVMGVTSMAPQEAKVFRADRPFLFAIQDSQSGNVIFIGRIVDPTK